MKAFCRVRLKFFTKIKILASFLHFGFWTWCRDHRVGIIECSLLDPNFAFRKAVLLEKLLQSKTTLWNNFPHSAVTAAFSDFWFCDPPSLFYLYLVLACKWCQVCDRGGRRWPNLETFYKSHNLRRHGLFIWKLIHVDGTLAEILVTEAVSTPSSGRHIWMFRKRIYLLACGGAVASLWSLWTSRAGCSRRNVPASGGVGICFLRCQL